MDFFDLSGGSVIKPVVDKTTEDPNVMQEWWNKLIQAGQEKKVTASKTKALSPAELDTLARQVFEDINIQAENQGVILPESYLHRLMGELSGFGPLMEIIAQPDVEDIAINLSHIYVYKTGEGWVHYGQAPETIGEAIRVMIDRSGQKPPTPDYPIADAMLQTLVPVGNRVVRKGLRINYIMKPASPYGDVITIRVSNYRTTDDFEKYNLAKLCTSRLPPIKRPDFRALDLPRGNGVFTPEAANYLLSVMVHGGTLIVSGTTGSGKTFISQTILQQMLNFYPRGAIRLFIIEDSNEINLNGWNGDPKEDTGNIVYTVTRPEIRGGAPPVTMYDLIRAALRSRPHGIIIGEARGAEAWELIRAAATGHGYSSFTIHATSAEHVWSRFYQVVQSHPDVEMLTNTEIAQSFAEAVTAVVHIERSPDYGQIIREIAEVSQVVEPTAGRPSFNVLFRFDKNKGLLLPTGNRPMRQGFQATQLGLPENYFQRSMM